MSDRIDWELVCDTCGGTADFLGARPGDDRPTWRPLCRDHHSDEIGGYWISMGDLLGYGMTWWLFHIEGKSWGKRSDFRWIVRDIAGYSSDPEQLVRRVPAPEPRG